MNCVAVCSEAMRREARVGMEKKKLIEKSELAGFRHGFRKIAEDSIIVLQASLFTRS